MAGVQRTPPKTPNSQTNNLSQNETKSEPDNNSAVARSGYVSTSRNKRLRHNTTSHNSPQGVAVLSSQELQDQLEEWKVDQNTTIANMLADQTAVISKLATDIAEIKTQNTLIQVSNAEVCKSNEEIVKSMSFINVQFEELKREVEYLRKERQEQKLYIENLEKKIQDLQYKSRSSGVEIRNIPQSDTETCDSLVRTVRSLGKTVGVQIAESDLRDIYRLPGKSSTNPASLRPIIAEFSSVQKKLTLISAVRSYNKDKGKSDKINTALMGIPGTSQPVYVAEQLPANTKKLFYLTREFAKNNHYKFCWISNGNIFLRKKEGDRQILIRSEKCLQVAINTNM